MERIECQARNLVLKINFHPCCKKISTYVMLRLVSMMFMLEGMEATSMAVLLVMLASPSDPESDPETTLRWPLGTCGYQFNFKIREKYCYLEALRGLVVGRMGTEVHRELLRLRIFGSVR